MPCQGKDLTLWCPDLAAALAEQVTPGCVIDGEELIWAGDGRYDGREPRTEGPHRPGRESNGGTRSRMDWQNVLGLIEAVGGRRWQITTSGSQLLQDRVIVTPEAFDEGYEQVVEIAEPPAEIAALLEELSTSARTHDSRSTYNIWVPSPPSNPNKVENLRTVINAALDRDIDLARTISSHAADLGVAAAE